MTYSYDWANQYFGVCDFSFAIAKGPSRRCAERASLRMVDDTTYFAGYDDNSLVSTSSGRSVTFSDDVECHTVSRYIDKKNRGKLFYSSTDVARFKYEVKLEKIQNSIV